ncbi:MAG: chromosome segregation protein SMC [Atopobiaceae bacterium]|nr:chromosome segregation protein SMC [Atopobiaceae bacterium]
MYLKSLTLKGFKSFADRTHMVFDPGLTVVVGPNGSGKSNVSDSILWVLGEQSAKQLRGQAMEDVIFSGSSARKPVGLAEVTLVLDNTDHTLPIDFSEVAITRRMYRSGESEYLINNSPCRLMDITDILHDSGLGKDTHSIISQGKLDSILASRPEERRSLIEEAAGISKHRRRKERSERKLRSMQENLTRAKDIQREIGRQLRPLERQVDKAKRHRDLTARLREVSATLAVDDLRLLQENYARLTARGNEAEAAVELAQYRTTEKERELEKLQSLLEQKGLFVGDLGEQRRRMQDLLGRMDSDMRLLEEKGRNMVSRLSEMRMTLSSAEKQRNDTAAEKERVSGELSDARVKAADLSNRVRDLQQEAKQATELRRTLGNRYAQLVNEQRQSQRTADTETLAYAKLEDQISNAKLEDEMFESRLAQIAETLATAEEALSERTERREQLAAELDRAQAAAEEAEANIRSCRSAIDGARSSEAKEREKLSKARATLSALESVDEQSENASGLTAAIAASNEGLELVECRLADLIEVPAELDELVERLLGDDLAAIVVDGADDAARLAESAVGMGRATGRATILSLGGRATDARMDAPGERLLDRLGCDPKAEGMLAALLGDVRVVSDATAAVRAHDEAPDLTFVTESGVTVLPDGRIVVGAEAGAEQGALERKRRIRALQEGMSALEGAHADAQTALAEAEAALSDAREASARAKGEVARIRGEHQSIGSEIGRLEAQRNQAVSEQAQVSKRRAAASQKADQARPQIEQHRKAAREAEARVVEIGEQLEQLSGERSRASRAENDANARVADARLELATTMERRNNLERREHDLTKTLADLVKRRDAAERSARSLEVLRLRVDPLYDRYEAIHGRALEWAELLRDRSRLAEADSDSLKATIGNAKEAVNEASGELQRARDAVNEVKVEMGRVEVQVENAINAITSQGFVLDEALTLPAPEDRATMEAEAETLRRKIANIGPVNEVAMDEYTRLKERSDYIDEQVADLERARSALAKITAAIERKMRRQFLVIFDAVNANFAEVFSMLFPGGQAHLEMTDPDHLSETGIEIVAQPRGKRIQKMMLMSGGEKSLTALALLFAVYKTRTVPFYVFDEVEAALDDSNLSKLLDAIEQLKDTTQLIVISHQRRTMEQADVLYGVSMQADGVSHVVSQRLDRATGKVVDA